MWLLVLLWWVVTASPRKRFLVTETKFSFASFVKRQMSQKQVTSQMNIQEIQKIYLFGIFNAKLSNVI